MKLLDDSLRCCRSPGSTRPRCCCSSLCGRDTSGTRITAGLLAHRNFNQGLRGYYFGVATLSWFLHPALMLAVTLGVIYVLHQREFRSHTLEVLLQR